MKKPSKTPITKKLMFILLASGGFALAPASHAADVGAGAGAQVGVGAGGGAGAAGAGVSADAQVGGSAGATGSGAAGRIDSATDAQIKADGGTKEPMPMMQDSTRGLEHAKEQMSTQGIEHEQATEATGKVETKKSAKTKRDKKPTRDE